MVADLPKASVLVLTYNHEKYIEAALQSALQQKTDFAFEIVIAEDCSTDRTLEKVRAVAAANPGLFRILPRPANLGIARNFADAYGQCRGQYVAILEGDDLWQHPYKLQRHVNYLDRHPTCSFVFNDVRVLFEADGREQDSCYPGHIKNKLTLLDFVANNFINCSSLTFRHRLLDPLPAWFYQLAYYDWILHILHLQHGYARYISEPLSTYRIHGKAAWQGADNGTQIAQVINVLRIINQHLDFKYDSILRLNENYWRLQGVYHALVAENTALRKENGELRQGWQGETAAQRQEMAGLRQALHESHRQRGELVTSRAFRLAQLLSRLRTRSLRIMSWRAA